MHHLIVRVAFLDVGQGDTIIVSTPETGEAVVVDCVDPEVVFKYLGTQGIRYIRGLIITHLHLDHYKGAVQFFENCEAELNVRCERVVFNWPYLVSKKDRLRLLQDEDQHSSGASDEKTIQRHIETAYQRLESWANQYKELCRSFTRENETPIVKGPIGNAIEVMQPWHGQIGKLQNHGLNNTSGVLKIYGSGSSALLTGDIELIGWQQLQSNYPDLRSDVLKFPHHGAWQNTNPDFLLDVIAPSIIVISVGTEGIHYKHPNHHVFEAIAKRRHIRLLCTQATNQCEADVSKKAKVVKQLFEKDAAVNRGRFYHDQPGCPCAGTVIIELGESPVILQPETTFHRETIITSHFHSYRCAI